MEILLLRLVHVLGGIFWVGAGVFNFVWIAPALAAAGPAAAGPVMQTLQQRRLFVVLPSVALLTMLSGLRLMMIQSGNFGADYFRTGIGATFAIGGAAAIVAFAIGIFSAMPGQRRLAALAADMVGADESSRGAMQAEMGRIQRRLRVVGPLITLLLVFAAACMAVARYL